MSEFDSEDAAEFGFGLGLGLEFGFGLGVGLCLGTAVRTMTVERLCDCFCCFLAWARRFFSFFICFFAACHSLSLSFPVSLGTGSTQG
jgi:hypothetical protein